jgi:hypothetical protein
MFAATHSTYKDGAALASKREIVTHLVNVHMLALQLFKCEQRHYTKQSAPVMQFNESLTEKEREIARKLDEERKVSEEENSSQDNNTWKLPSVFGVPASVQSARDFTLEELDLILSNTGPNALYNFFLLAQKRLFELSQRAVMNYGSQTVNGKVSIRYDSEIFVFKDFSRFQLEAEDNMAQLECVLETLRSLRNSVGKAAESSHLSKDELQALKIKLTAFDIRLRYSDATRLAFPTREHQPCLTNARSERWW